jgi:rhodanese-related sulfurtransferase
MPLRTVSPMASLFAVRRLATVSLLCATLAATAAGASGVDSSVVSLEEARARAEAGSVILIDIREPREHATGVAAGARLLPMSELPQRLAEIPSDPGKPVLLICNTKNRSGAILRALRNAGGYDHVKMVDGGMSEWVKRGWPTVKPGG